MLPQNKYILEYCEKIKQAKKDFAKASTKWINSHEHRKIIDSIKILQQKLKFNHK